MLSRRLRESLSICSAAAESSVETGRRTAAPVSRHLIHCSHDRLRAGSLFLDRGIDFLRNFGQASRWLSAICEEPTDCSAVAAPDLLGEFVNFGDHVGNLVQRGT